MHAGFFIFIFCKGERKDGKGGGAQEKTSERVGKRRHKETKEKRKKQKRKGNKKNKQRILCIYIFFLKVAEQLIDSRQGRWREGKKRERGKVS